MFKAKVARAAALVLLATGAAVLMSCQAEVTAPVEEASEEQFDTNHGIEGYVTDAMSSDPIADVDVHWECETCDKFLGENATDAYGYYEIDYEGDWSDHDGHNLKRYASKTGYQTGTNTITNFQSANMPYRRDFTLYEE